MATEFSKFFASPATPTSSMVSQKPKSEFTQFFKPTGDGSSISAPAQPEQKKSGFQKFLDNPVTKFFTGNTQRFGKTVGEAINAPEAADSYSESLKTHTDLQSQLLKAIAKKKQLGQDTKKLEEVLQEHIGATPKLEDYTGDVVNKTAKQVVGEAVSTLPEILQGGAYGKGAEILADKSLTIPQKFVGGFKTGLPYGLVGGGGEAAAQNGTPGDIAINSALGGLIAGGTGGVLEAGIGSVGALANKIRAGKSTYMTAEGKLTPEAEALASRILGGNEKATPAEANVLRNLNPAENQTFEQGIKTVSDTIGDLSKKVDTQLDTDLTKRKIGAYNISVGETGVKHNYVKDAIAELDNYYKKINDIEGQTKLKEIKTKLRTEGLTAKEVNDLARLHGQLRSGFNLNGELSTGLTKQGYENTRKGVKSTVRGLPSGKATEALDKEISANYDVRDKFEKFNKKVISLQNRMNKPGLLQRVGAKGGTLFDIATGNFVRGLVREVANLSQTKGATSVELEQELAKNLMKLQKLEDILSSKEPRSSMLVKLSRFLNKQVVDTSVLDSKLKDGIKESITNPSIGLSIKSVGGNPDTLKGQEFKGFEDLTTKILDKLKGRTTVSKQFIFDLTNSPDLKQAERNLIREVLGNESNTVSVKDFADKVKTELLPLERQGVAEQYENISLPDELRGNVADYSEHIYNSPIKTSAGDVHFSRLGSEFGEGDGYFAHTRVEDLAMNPSAFNEITPAGNTRRVIELQSDLFQKERLQSEVMERIRKDRFDFKYKGKPFEVLSRDADAGIVTGRIEGGRETKIPLTEFEQENASKFADVNKLEPYRNTWQDRIIREEVKQAAKDGKTKLQFPTGETAMKIEGLGGDNHHWNIGSISENLEAPLTPDRIKVGQTINNGRDWVITKDLGDGKFEAVDDLAAQNTEEVYKFLEDINMLDDGLQPSIGELHDVLPPVDWQEIVGILERENGLETFDISSNVDKNNPIYKFYEKEVGRYLKNKYNAKQVTDPQGVTWWEVDVPKSASKAPVEAFAIAPLAIGTSLANKRKERQ